MTYAIYAGIFYLGIFIGFIFHWWLSRRTSYSGVINVDRFPDKTVFSLELDEDPEELAYKDEVVFRVITIQETAQENGDRS